MATRLLVILTALLTANFAGTGAPLAATYPGDCNADWTVSIGEVQRSINMFLEVEPPSCASDANGDGAVSIGEVQRVINCFLGDCPAPVLVGLDTDGDGEADVVDADGNGVLDAALDADCSAASALAARLVALYAGPSPTFAGTGLPQGMTLQPDGLIAYLPPCTDEGSTFSPTFTVNGLPGGLAAPFRVTRSLRPTVVGVDVDGDGTADIVDADGNGAFDAPVETDCDYTAPKVMRLIAADAGEAPVFAGASLPWGMTLSPDGRLLFNPACDQLGLTYLPNFSVNGGAVKVGQFKVIRLPKVALDADGDAGADFRDRDGDGLFDWELELRMGDDQATTFSLVGLDAGAAPTFCWTGLEPWMQVADGRHVTLQAPVEGVAEAVYAPQFCVEGAGRSASVPVTLEVPVYRRWFDFSATGPWYTCSQEVIPPEATVVTAYDRAYHWFGSENHRSIVQEVEFPTSGTWSQVGLLLKLECPESGRCDHWDRLGSVRLVQNPEAEPSQWHYTELARHITPYNRGMCQYIDVTHLGSLLRGRRTLESFIDTWVGPGHSDGEGWRITVQFVFYPGLHRPPDEVVTVYGRRDITVGWVDPERSVAAQTPPVAVPIPADAKRVQVHVATTGHSFGNTGNCAEFCEMRQDVYVNGTLNSLFPWRGDCERNPVSPQDGTWRYDRNGWCPGSIVPGFLLDVTRQVVPGTDATFDFDIRLADGREYDNTAPVDWAPFEAVALEVLIYR